MIQRESLAQRTYYGKALAHLAGRKNIVVLDADLAESTKTSEFKKAAPEKFIEVGIAEQNMIGIASGLASSGKTVFASTFAVFATGRCWEQIRLTVAYPKSNVKIVSTHSGISVGQDGASHQALEDIALMRALPNMTVISPADAYEAYSATLAMADYDGPCYMRLGRSEYPVVTEKDKPFKIGKATLLRRGDDVTLIGTGQMTSTCMDAAEYLMKKGISTEVINMSTIKPLDKNTIKKSLEKTKCVVTAEEHNIIGGLGSAVAEYLAESGTSVPFIRIGVKDMFGQSGQPAELMSKYGLTSRHIVAAAKKCISKK